jgi:helicase SWR1
MDRQCEDRAHRIGQIRDVHVYRFISEHTVEEAMLRKADQKRSLDDLVIQKGGFDWRDLFGDEGRGVLGAGGDHIARALEEFVDTEDARAAQIAEREGNELEGADMEDFGDEGNRAPDAGPVALDDGGVVDGRVEAVVGAEGGDGEEEDGEEEEDGGTTAEYMVSFIQANYEHFSCWQIRAS